MRSVREFAAFGTLHDFSTLVSLGLVEAPPTWSVGRAGSIRQGRRSPGVREVPDPMFLKRVRVTGFKSFPDRVDFDFGPGVTCIVGPNGCGKSNVVDAIKWVLGEQSARSLRGGVMLDMIFNGSSTRRSSSVAQVDLVFDNATRALPVDQEEVTVTRKLYRSGESEYLLNHSAARLKDVRELFMDTGVGVDAYSVIEQGKVDSLLQSNPADRRVIFEEAAGISKYKARRREAQRKLERTQQNLLRVADIIEELEKQLRSVKLQAGKARSYMQYEARLNELRSSYAMAQYHRFAGQITGLTSEVQDRTDKSTALNTEITRYEAEGSEITLKIDRLVSEIHSVENSLVQAKSDRAAQAERIEAARQRVAEQQALLARVTERRLADSARLEESRGQLSEVQESAVKLEQQTHRLRGRIDELTQRDQGLARDLTRGQALLEDEKTGIIDLLRRSAQMHNEVIRLNTQRESLVGQKGRLSQRSAVLRLELEKQLEQKVQLKRRLAEIDSLIAEENRRLEEKKGDAARAQDLRQQLAEQLASARQKLSAMGSRRELLQDLERRMEGVGAGVRQLLERKRQSDAPGVLDTVAGLVGDMFDTDLVHAAIIEALLGDSDQHLVISESREFLTHPELFGDLPGRLSVLCLDRLPPIVNPRDFSAEAGFVARAIDLVRYPPAYESLARYLFAKTVVVEDLHAALTMASSDVLAHRFVTLRGEVVEPDGRVSFGPPTSRAGLISRKSELRAIETDIRQTDELVVTLSDQLNRSEAEVSHLDGVQQELRTAIYEANTARIEANSALQTIADAVGRLTGEQPLIAGEVAIIEQQINDVLEKSAQGGRTIEVMERENVQRERAIADHRKRIDEVVDERRQVQEQATEAKVASGQLTEKRAAANETINTLRRAIGELEASVEAVEADREQCRTRIAQAEEAISAGDEDLTSLAERIEEFDGASIRLKRERDMLRLGLENLDESVKSTRSRLSGVQAELHDQQMTLASTNVRRDELVTRTAAELGIDLAERYRQDEYQEQDWQQVESEISELRGKMERLGNVNLDAINELEGLEKRHGFLSTQRDDLVSSHRQLEQLIDKLNAESRQRFKVSFEQIREHFRTMFRRLFGGGRADIVLEDPEDILESGIEIVAQPPGKELLAISLMSGGEKSMTAIALLMSIFKSRPAPFAILDEVDAALDEANNERFNRIVQEFVKDSQFIIITHSKWTMNIADQLYGITMQEPGVSTRVSVQLTGANVA